MDRPPVLRSDEKLPRGSYFYIQVGHRFYGGEEAETREVEVSNEEPIVTYYQKGGKPSASLARRWADNGYVFSNRWGSNRARRARDERKGTLAEYAKVKPRPKKTTKTELTGQLTPRLVDEQKGAKQFRRQDKVNAACERLRLCYEGLDVKVTVRFEKGENQ